MRRSMLVVSVIFLAMSMSLALLIPVKISGAQQSETEGTTSPGTVSEETVSVEKTSEDAVSEETTSESTTSEKEEHPAEPSSGKEAAQQLRQGESIYRVEPPDLYPEEESIPESGEDFPAYNQVVNNTNESNLVAPGWKVEASKPDSYGKNYLVPKKSGKPKPARYTVKIPADDVYSVFAWWPRKAGKGATAQFGVTTESGVKWSKVDQSVDGGYWMPIGEYEMRKGKRSIRIASSGGPAVADTVAVVRGIFDYPPDPQQMGQKTGGTGKAGNKTASSNEATFSGQSAKGRRISRQKIIQRARRHLGTPYKLGGLAVCKPYITEDCSCFTRLVFKKWRTLNDNPASQLKARKMKKVRKKNLLHGDLVFHDTSGDGKMGAYDHVSIYAGNGYIIHANSYYMYKKVHRQKMKYLKNFKGARRVRH